MPDAKSVSLVGSFNGWHGGNCDMHRNETAWTITLHIPKGRYEYAFLVDGEEIVPDPGARIYQDDGFGKKNAVLIVGNPDEKAI
jgi:1,4-alpha-glucan branching enzyme